MYMTNNKDEVMEVLRGPEHRRRWFEKLRARQDGLDGCAAARHHSESTVSVRKLRQDGSLSTVSAGEEVAPVSELSDALKQVKKLQRLLGKKIMENELLREAVEVTKSRKWIARSPALPGDGQ